MAHRNCGNCRYFIRMKSMEDDPGICDFIDCRTKTDYGHYCKKFKSIKYNRHTAKLVTTNLISEEI